MKNMIVVLFLSLLLQGCSEKVETIDDVFLKVNLGTKIQNIPKLFSKRPDGDFEAFIDGFNVKLSISKSNVSEITAEKEYGEKGSHITSEFKQLRSSIFYKLVNKNNAKIASEHLDSPHIWTVPDGWGVNCNVQMYGESNIYIELNNDSIMKLVVNAGKEKPSCDNPRKARGVLTMESMNGSVKILKKYR